jgi:hypothetical protein
MLDNSLLGRVAQKIKPHLPVVSSVVVFVQLVASADSMPMAY